MIRCCRWSVFSCLFFSRSALFLKKHDSRLPATTCHKTETRSRWPTGSGSQEVILDMKLTWTDTRYMQIQEATQAWPKVWLCKELEMQKRQQERVAMHYRSAASYIKKWEGFFLLSWWTTFPGKVLKHGSNSDRLNEAVLGQPQTNHVHYSVLANSHWQDEMVTAYPLFLRYIIRC